MPSGVATRLPDLGQRRRGLDVGGVLVDQAALEPAALPRHLGRGHGQVLVLGHLDRHRGELRQEGRAAELAPARPDAAHHLGLVAHADLAQLDAGVVASGQIADQIPEVDALLGGEIEDGASATLELGAEDLDPELVDGGAFAGERQRLGRPLLGGAPRARSRSRRGGGRGRALPGLPPVVGRRAEPGRDRRDLASPGRRR